MLRQIRLLISDLDYLLFDCAALKIRAVREGLIPFADRIPHDVRLPDAVDAEEGFLESGRHWIQSLPVGLDGESLSAFQKDYPACEQRLIGAGAIYPGLIECLSSCHKHLLLAIGAEASREYLLAVSDQHNLDRIFEIAYCTEEFGAGCGEEMIEELLERAEVCPSEALVLGTRSDSFRAARAVGVLSLGCGWGLHRHDTLAEADLQVLAIAQLIPALEKADLFAGRDQRDLDFHELQ